MSIALVCHFHLKNIFQLLSTMVAVLPSIGAGSAMAFTSIAATQYRTENATSLIEPLTEDQSSWFGKYYEAFLGD